jgi:DNA helicase IV
VWSWLHDGQRLPHYAAQDLTRAEIDLLLRSWRPDDPSVQDVPLLDELRYLLGDEPQEEEQTRRDRVDGISDAMNALLDAEPRQLMSFETGQRSAPTRRTEDDSCAHVLLDEAQDLSPMQWRMVGRRGRHASWTVVGDPAQSSWPHPEEASRARDEALSGLALHSFRLSTNYRNSAEVYDFAATVARIAVPDPDLPDAVRRTGREPEHRLIAEAEVETAVRAAVTEMADSVEGTVAVVVPVAMRASLEEYLATTVAEYEGRVFVLGGIDTKGLEFDGVLVVEPGRIVAESESGWRTLYVVLTRAVQRMLSVGSDGEWLRRVEQARG